MWLTSTDLDQALSDRSASIYFDAQVTSERKKSILKAMVPASTLPPRNLSPGLLRRARSWSRPLRSGRDQRRGARQALPARPAQDCERLIDSGFFGRILSVRGGVRVLGFESDLLPAQRPWLEPQAEDGGGMVSDMFPHWNYVLENLFRKVQAVTAIAVTHIPERWDEQAANAGHRRRRVRTIFGLEGDVIAQVNSSWAVRVDRGEAHPDPGRRHPRLSGGRPVRLPHPARVHAPMQWNPDLPTTEGLHAASGSRSRTVDNGFRAQWEQYLSDVDAHATTRTTSPPAFEACRWSSRTEILG